MVNDQKDLLEKRVKSAEFLVTAHLTLRSRNEVGMKFKEKERVSRPDTRTSLMQQAPGQEPSYHG